MYRKREIPFLLRMEVSNSDTFLHTRIIQQFILVILIRFFAVLLLTTFFIFTLILFSIFIFCWRIFLAILIPTQNKSNF